MAAILIRAMFWLIRGIWTANGNGHDQLQAEAEANLLTLANEADTEAKGE